MYSRAERKKQKRTWDGVTQCIAELEIEVVTTKKKKKSISKVKE